MLGRSVPPFFFTASHASVKRFSLVRIEGIDVELVGKHSRLVGVTHLHMRSLQQFTRLISHLNIQNVVLVMKRAFS